MSSGGKGNSRAQTSSQSSTTNSQTTLNQVDNRVFEGGDGSVVVEGSSNSITTTDHGAIAAALDFGDDALGFGRSALDFGGEAIGRIADAADSDRGFLADVFEGSSDFARNLFGDSLEAVTGVLREGQAQLGNTVTTLNQIAREQSKGEAERVQDIASQALKIGAIMVGLIAAAFIFTKARA